MEEVLETRKLQLAYAKNPVYHLSQEVRLQRLAGFGMKAVLNVIKQVKYFCVDKHCACLL